jgi:hypothetical protein
MANLMYDNGEEQERKLKQQAWEQSFEEASHFGRVSGDPRACQPDQQHRAKAGP